MQIILLEEMTNLGKLGDVVRVKNGYARNFLIPSHKARRATATAIAEFEERRADIEKAAREKRAKAQTLADALAAVRVQLSEKAGMDGRLFGSVNNGDIAGALKKQGFAVEKSQVRLSNGPIKLAGEYTVTVVLHTEVAVEINVRVVGEAA